MQVFDDRFQAESGLCFTLMLLCVVIDFFLNNQQDALITEIYSVIKLYMFRASSLPIIRSKFGIGKFHAVSKTCMKVTSAEFTV